MGKKVNVVYERPQLIPTDNQAFGHHPKKYGKKRLTKAFRVAGKEKKQMQKLLIIINTKLFRMSKTASTLQGITF